MGFKSVYNHYQVETQTATFSSSDSVSITWTSAFEVLPVVTLMHSGSMGDDESHQNFHIESLTKAGCTIRSTIDTNTSIHVQAIAVR